VQRAIDKGGPRLFFPAGHYLISDADELSGATGGLLLRGDLELSGEGDRSILKQGATTNYLASANRYDGGTRNPSDNLKNIVIRDLQFQGPGRRGSLKTPKHEHVHLLNLNAVSQVRIENCLFSGFQGDGLYLGSGNADGLERHNQDVAITRCRFNGIDRMNRNGISIIDGERILIEDCLFENCTADEMPGCIDIEPDEALFHVVKDIRISRCQGINCGGAGVQILKKQPFATSWGRIEISACSFAECVNGIYSKMLHSDSRAERKEDKEAKADGGAGPTVRVRQSTFTNCRIPFQIIGGRDCEASDNLVSDCGAGVVLGGTTAMQAAEGGYDDEYAMGLRFVRNRIYRSGASEASQFAGCMVSKNLHLQMNDNMFVDCGDGQEKGSGVAFFAGDVRVDAFKRNTFVGSGARKTAAVTVWTGGLKWTCGH